LTSADGVIASVASLPHETPPWPERVSSRSVPRAVEECWIEDEPLL
jgi:hypothetical protein